MDFSMKADVQKYRAFPNSGRIAALIVFTDEAGKVVREECVIVPGGLSLEGLWREAIKAAKQKCSEQCFKESEEEPPRCEHGEPLLDFLGLCWVCRLQDERG
jgi:hypothetical protein